MKELKRKTFLTICGILTGILLVSLVLINIQGYNRERESIVHNLRMLDDGGVLGHGPFELQRGRQTPERLSSTLVNLLLFAVMLLLPLSGILLSKHLFVFLPASGLSFAARTTHLLCSYWGFALMGLHLGQHVEQMLGGRKKHRAVMAIGAKVESIRVNSLSTPEEKRRR